MEKSIARKILISDDINNGVAKETIQKIFDINYDDQSKAKEYKEFEIEPIQLYINSFGGEAYGGLAIVDAILSSQTPVYTYCIGCAMSMGLWIYMAGNKRFVGKNSTFMYHEITHGIYDKLTGIKLEIKESDRLQAMYDDIIVKNSNIMQETLEDYKTRKAEWYISSLDSIKLGIANELL